MKVTWRNKTENFDDTDSLPDLEFVSDSKIDNKDLLESFGKEYFIPSCPSSSNNPDTPSEVPENLDSPSEEFIYVPLKEEAYVTMYEASEL